MQDTDTLFALRREKFIVPDISIRARPDSRMEYTCEMGLFYWALSIDVGSFYMPDTFVLFARRLLLCAIHIETSHAFLYSDMRPS